MILFVSIVSLLFAMLPAVMFLFNLPLFRGLKDLPLDSNANATVSVLIPARDESVGIESCLRSVLLSQNVSLEVLVMDDHSTDNTRQIVQQIAAHDDRVRCYSSDALPPGWNGKQFACFQLAQQATHEHLAFMDADVRLSPDALRRMIDHKRETKAGLLSQFPHQVTETVAEKLFIPLMHFILLSYLPFARMRSTTHPAYAAGCGQFFLTTQTEYRQAGTHQLLASSRHDGVKLPKVYRNAGLSTDVVDGTNLAECRMYDGASQVIRGVLKNAVEGIAHPGRIVPFSVLLIFGSVVPVVALIAAVTTGNKTAIVTSLLAVVVGHLPRILAAVYFRQSWLGVICHSVAVLAFVILQWIALAFHLCGKQVAWRGRQ